MAMTSSRSRQRLAARRESRPSLRIAIRMASTWPWGRSLEGAEHILRGDQGLVLQQAAEGFYLLFGPVGEVGQGALEGLRAFAPTFAEEDGGRGVAIGDGLDVHGSIIC